MKSSTTLSVDGSQDTNTKLETSPVKSSRKRKRDELDLSNPLCKLQQIAEEDEEGNKIGQVGCLKEGSLLCFGALPSSSAALTSTDDVAKHKTNLPVVSPTKVTLKEKEVEISPKANRQQQSVLSSPKASRKLIFETEVERQEPQFVLVRTSGKENIIKTESKTDIYKEEKIHSATVAPSVSSSNDSSPEIEILNSKTSRQNIEVVFQSSHLHDSAKNSSQCEIPAGRKRASGDTVEVVNIEDNSGREEDVDTEAECSDAELFLHLSPSPSQKSMDVVSRPDKCSSSHSASVSADHISSSSYKSSSAYSLDSASVSEQEISNTTKQDKKLLERHSIYTIQEEEPEETSQIQSSGSSTNSEHTNGSCIMSGKKKNMPFSLAKKDIVSPEGSPYVTDSFTTFSKVKDVAQFTSVGQSQSVASVVSESEHRISKRKRDAGRQDIPVVSIVGSDSESDGHSTPSEVQKKARTENVDVINGHKGTPSILSQKPTTVLREVIYQFHHCILNCFYI
jgi:hypothetical protein